MQQPNFSQKLLESSSAQPFLNGQPFPKEEYYGGARVFPSSPFPPQNMMALMNFNNPGAGPSLLDSQKIKKKERNASNSSERARGRSGSLKPQNSIGGGGSYPPGNIKKPPIIREGDWECPECKNINFAKRTECNRCKASKPLPSKKDRKPASHLGGPPGLFKEGDWVCSKCRNVNFQRRSKCNRCGEGKPDDNEVRTGKGGGHYDRQDPKDKKNYKESDDEYDDFGRKKKKKSSKQKSQSPRSRSGSNGRERDRYREDSRERKRKKSRDSRSRDRQRHSKSREREKRSRS